MQDPSKSFVESSDSLKLYLLKDYSLTKMFDLRSTNFATMVTPPSLQDRIKDFIVTNLREEHPYMKIDAVHDSAIASLETLDMKIKEQ